MRKSVIAGLAAGVLLALGLGTPVTAVESGKAELFVLHGIPATPVDVWVNGAKALPNFVPGDFAGPLPLAPGAYTFVLTAVGAADISSPVLTVGPVNLAADTSYTAVAHLSDMGTPMVSLFTNDISATPSGKGRLTVRHVAAAPAVDILANGAVAFPGLVNPNEVKADLPVGTYEAKVNLAGTATTAIGPANVNVTSGKNSIVYAWGSAADNNLALYVQTLSTMGAPSGVSAGSAPLPSDGSTTPIALIVVSALALIGAGFATRSAIASRR